MSLQFAAVTSVCSDNWKRWEGFSGNPKFVLYKFQSGILSNLKQQLFSLKLKSCSPYSVSRHSKILLRKYLLKTDLFRRAKENSSEIPPVDVNVKIFRRDKQQAAALKNTFLISKIHAHREQIWRRITRGSFIVLGLCHLISTSWENPLLFLCDDKIQQAIEKSFGFIFVGVSPRWVTSKGICGFQSSTCKGLAEQGSCQQCFCWKAMITQSGVSNLALDPSMNSTTCNTNNGVWGVVCLFWIRLSIQGLFSETHLQIRFALGKKSLQFPARRSEKF